MAASMHLTPQDFSHPGYTLVKSRPNAWEGSSPLNRYPSESDLREVFVANCGTNPAGVYRDAPPKRWVIPPSVVDRNAGSLFEQLLLQGSGGPR